MIMARALGRTLLGFCLLTAGGCTMTQRPTSMFEQSSDVGTVRFPGTTKYDDQAQTYTLTGSGANIWGTEDAFHFAWKRASGDLRLQGRIRFQGSDGEPHRKAGWMIRAGLDADDPYADVAVHGNGLVSLQFRREKGGETVDVAAVTQSPTGVRLERTGNVFSLWVTDADGKVEPVGAVVLDLPDQVYTGLFVCAHNPDRQETAVFSDLQMSSRVQQPGEERVTESTLETIEVATGRRSIVYAAQAHFEAPNWSRDGHDFLFNQGGRIYRLVEGDTDPTVLDTGDATRCNNDHGLSPDGKWLAVSHSPENQSLIYVLPAGGGDPRQVTQQGPSYWHGWSPDGKTLAYCAERGGNFDIYTIPVSGGKERRLTTADGLDDGPDYTPDGHFIYFNSERSGLMKIWRLTPDGATQEPMTSDDVYADWFPHPSPDGQSVAFLSFDRSVQGHPPNQAVVLRVMPLEGGEPRIVAHLFGGQGTINVPSWSPDSSHFAFVSYRLILPGW